MSSISSRPTKLNLRVFGCLLAAIMPVFSAFAANPGEQLVSDDRDKGSAAKEAVATLAGGCFWCTEAVFERMKGVNDVVSGYIGGHVPNPTYEQVCGKQTGHAEAVEIYYDPTVTSYQELLEVFFKTHDPTTLNKQGHDEGPQYASVVFYHDEDQKKATEKYIAKLNASGEFDGPIVTKVKEATKFYPAEEYHQDYFRRNPYAGYCQAVVKGKVRKFNTVFEDKLKSPTELRNLGK